MQLEVPHWKKNAEKLIKVFKDTFIYCHQINKISLKSKRYFGKIKEKRLNPFSIKTIKIPNIQVINEDCIVVANEMVEKYGKTCMLNMANAFNRGGGVTRGSMAQEEELCRRSNLWFGLKKEFYPLNTFGYIYTKDVTFFKDKYYNFIPNFKCDIITIAAPNLNGKPTPDNYEEIIETKIKQMLYIPAQRGCKNLILSAFGCGAFKNNPEVMSKMFKAQLKNLPYDNIFFAILDDQNSKENGFSNFNIFKNTLNDTRI